LSAVRPTRSQPTRSKQGALRENPWRLFWRTGFRHLVAQDRHREDLVSFDYGQRHRKELDYARRCATRLGVTHDIIDITDIGRCLTGSALTDGTAVPDGHYAEETMRSTIVPNRNVIMLTIAFGVATVRRAEAVAAAVHGGDHFIYPDCRLSFVDAFATMQRNSLWSRSPPQKRGKASIRSQRNPQYSRQSQLGRLSGLAQ
jgi:7-cyano-7-deazaguanine synthase in queuosine biosynthesis